MSSLAEEAQEGTLALPNKPQQQEESSESSLNVSSIFVARRHPLPNTQPTKRNNQPTNSLTALSDPSNICLTPPPFLKRSSTSFSSSGGSHHEFFPVVRPRRVPPHPFTTPKLNLAQEADTTATTTTTTTTPPPLKFRNKDAATCILCPQPRPQRQPPPQELFPQDRLEFSFCQGRPLVQPFWPQHNHIHSHQAAANSAFRPIQPHDQHDQEEDEDAPLIPLPDLNDSDIDPPDRVSSSPSVLSLSLEESLRPRFGLQPLSSSSPSLPQLWNNARQSTFRECGTPSPTTIG